MAEENQTQEMATAWVRTQIPDPCRQNARYISQKRSVTLEEIYRFFLTFCLWGPPQQALNLWDSIMDNEEADNEL